MDTVFKAIWKFLCLLIPPTDGDPAHVLAYRWAVSISLITIIFFVMLATGHVSGYAGFAWAADVEQHEALLVGRQRTVDGDFKQIQMLYVQDHLKQAARDICTAFENNNQLALDGANKEFDGLNERYWQLERRIWEHPTPSSCEVVLIKKIAP